jgi:hypothetical protein
MIKIWSSVVTALFVTIATVVTKHALLTDDGRRLIAYSEPKSVICKTGSVMKGLSRWKVVYFVGKF